MQDEQNLKKNTDKITQFKPPPPPPPPKKKYWQTANAGEKNKPKIQDSLQLRLLKCPLVTSTNTSQYQ